MTEGTGSRINDVTAYLVAALGIVIAAFTVIGSLASFGAVNDLPEYYAGAQMLIHGQAPDIYTLPRIFASEQAFFPSMGQRGVGLFVPPPGVLLMFPLAFIPSVVAPIAWTIFLTVALCGSLWLLIDWVKLDKKDTLWLVGLSFLSGPVVEALRLGQLAPIMLFSLVVFARLAQRYPAWAGVVLHVLVLKPQQLFPVLVYCAAALRKRIVIAAACALIVLFVASHLIFGQQGYGSYISVVTDPANLQFMQPELNPTFRGQLMRFLGLHSPVTTVIGVIALIASIAVTSFVAWRNRAQQNWLILCLIVALPVGLVASLHCHDYDLILLIPGLVLAVKTVWWHDLASWIKCAFMLGVVAFLLPFYNDIHYGYLLHGGLVNLHFILLLVYACGIAIAAIKQPDKFVLTEEASS